MIDELPDRIASAGDMGSERSDPGHGEGIELLRNLGFESVITLTAELAKRLDIDFTPGVIVKRVRPNAAVAMWALPLKNIRVLGC